MAPIRTNLLVAVLIGLASVAAAQAPEQAMLLRQLTQGNPSFLQFRVVDGRLSLTSRSLANFQNQNSSGDGRKETINVGNDGSRPTLHYERITPNEQLTIDIAAAGKVSIHRVPRGKASFTAVEFQQSPDEKTSLTLGTGAKRQMFRVADLWRLAIIQPKECQENLFPLLEMLRPDWRIAATAGRVETSLLARAHEDTAADRAHWATLVAQLADDQFTKREAADRALRAGGAAALGYLRQADFDRLDAEQQLRVRRIIGRLGGKNEGDSADEIAASMTRDRAVWLALLGRPEVAIRKVAAHQLIALLGEPIGVDPVAEPDTQKDKREKLRAQIEKK